MRQTRNDGWVPPEINSENADILFVGRDPGTQETAQGRPLVGPSGQLFNEILAMAGLRRKDVNITNTVGVQPPQNNFRAHRRSDVERGVGALHLLIQDLRPNLVVALGNEASYALVGREWPTQRGHSDIFGATGITDRRGYIWWNEDLGVKVLTTLHPASALVHRDPSGINSGLMLYDFEKAKRESSSPALERPRREVRVVTTAREAAEAVEAIRGSDLVSVDIECHDPTRLACVGFAPRPDLAFVFTPHQFNVACQLLQDEAVAKVFQHGQFDCYFLATRWPYVEVRGYEHDTSVAWHSCYPEIAGRSRKGSKRTYKSLHFFASLYTNDAWWKDYDFASDSEMYQLNGQDCCITHDVMGKLAEEISTQGVREIYEHEMRLVDVCLAIQRRGMLIDNETRVKSLSSLQERARGLESQIMAMIEPILNDRRDQVQAQHLFWKMKTCSCCGGGKKKSQACWSCLGFDKAPSKKTLVKYGYDLNPDVEWEKETKAELEELLPDCAACSGQGKWETFEFNPRSSQQVAEVLYNVLRLPKRFLKGKLTVDEESLKSILGAIS